MKHQQITHSPIDNSVCAVRDYATARQIDTTLRAAGHAQTAWQQVPLPERAALCHRMVDSFISDKTAIAEELCRQMGRPLRYTPGEVDGFAERARHMIDIAGSALAPLELPDQDGCARTIEKVPVGTVLIVAPWNYPYLTAVNALVPAIMAGNTVILKHSAQTPLCAERIYDAFVAAGLPDGVFQYLHLQHADVAALLQSETIQHLCFTGSVAGGRAMELAAAGHFVGAGLELGGKDPAYIRTDANLEQAARCAIDGAFFNSGQSCCGIERIYVHADRYDEFVALAIALVNDYVLGNPLDPETTLGPMVKASAADFVRGQIDEAIAQGAVAHIGPARFPADKKGTPYLAPQLLTGVNHSMRVMTEESFGPVVGIQKVSGDDEAISLMNDSEFGLTAAIFSGDLAAAKQIGRQLQTGTVFLNRCDYLDPALAWTGVKHSGRGCTLSSLGYDQLTRPKSWNLKTRV